METAGGGRGKKRGKWRKKKGGVKKSFKSPKKGRGGRGERGGEVKKGLKRGEKWGKGKHGKKKGGERDKKAPKAKLKKK